MVPTDPQTSLHFTNSPISICVETLSTELRLNALVKLCYGSSTVAAVYHFCTIRVCLLIVCQPTCPRPSFRPTLTCWTRFTWTWNIFHRVNSFVSTWVGISHIGLSHYIILWTVYCAGWCFVCVYTRLRSNQMEKQRNSKTLKYKAWHWLTHGT